MMQQPSRQEYEQRKEWERQEKREHYKVVSKMMEFFGAVLGMVCIFLLLALLFSLVSWLTQDISNTFSILKTRFQ